MKNLVIWRDVPVICEDYRGRRYYGDIPCITYNPITRKFEHVENRRGNAYAARSRMCYRKKKI
jgi:hypothetical protein